MRQGDRRGGIDRHRHDKNLDENGERHERHLASIKKRRGLRRVLMAQTRLLDVCTGNWVTTPLGVIRPTDSVLVNHRLPSGPVTTPRG